MAVAHRMYARALFQAARETGRLDPVAADIAALATALEEIACSSARSSPTRRSTRRRRPPCSRRSRPAQTTSSRNFLRLLAEKGRARELGEIAEELEALVAHAQNRLTVELTTAVELSEDEARSIVETIERASGRTVEATRSVDPSLIGGIVLRIGTFLADGSVRGRLERLRRELATAH